MDVDFNAVDVSANWWGTTVLADIAAILGVPATVDGVATDYSVDYTPFLGTATDGSGDTGFQANLSALTVHPLGVQTDFVPESDNDPAGRIEEAVDIADGSVVTVLPGTYDESASGISIDEAGLELAGSGRDVTFVLLEDRRLKINADDVWVHGFDLDGGGTVDIELHEFVPANDALCSGGGCPVVRVGGDVNGATVGDNAIHGGRRGVALGGGDSGVPASDNTVDGNDIFDNYTGVFIDGGSENVISDNEIHDNDGDGVHIHDTSGDNPTGNEILNNRIFDNDDDGIDVDDSDVSDTLIEDNEVTDNGSSNNDRGIELRGDGHMVINNLVEGNYDDGVHTRGDSTFDGNTITGNGFGAVADDEDFGPAGLTIDDTAGSIVKNNTITGNAVIGIKLIDDDGVLIDNNLISGNGVATEGESLGDETDTPAGILIITSDDAVITRNAILDNVGHGIFVVDATDLAFDSSENEANFNAIMGNTVSGVTDDQGGDPDAEHTRVSGAADAPTPAPVAGVPAASGDHDDASGAGGGGS